MRHTGRRSVAILYTATPSGPKRCSFPAHLSTRPAVVPARRRRRSQMPDRMPSPVSRPGVTPARTAARWLAAIGITLVGVVLAGRMASPHSLIVPAGGNPSVAAAAGCHASGGTLSGLVTQPTGDGGTEVLYFCEAG